MKRSALIFSALFLFSFKLSAQWSSTTPLYNIDGGSVGIGTMGIPNAKLEIRGPSIRISESSNRYLSISQDDQGTPYGRNWANNYAGGRQFKLTGFSHLPDNTGSVQKDIIHFDGYNLLLLKDNGGALGIGTSTPNAKIELVSDGAIIRFRGTAASSNTPMDLIHLGLSGGSGAMNLAFRMGYPYPTGVNAGPKLDWLKVINGNTILATNDSGLPLGRVAIGTTLSNANFNAAEPYKLYVKGGIRTEEVKVDIASTSNWADYVFDPSYELMPLSEVSAYIKYHKHLPEVPSSDEVLQNGVKLGEMNALLLKKIEELTLHLIRQEQELAEQTSALLKLQQELNALKK